MVMAAVREATGTWSALSRCALPAGVCNSKWSWGPPSARQWSSALLLSDPSPHDAEWTLSCRLGTAMGLCSVRLAREGSRGQLEGSHSDPSRPPPLPPPPCFVHAELPALRALSPRLRHEGGCSKHTRHQRAAVHQIR